MMRVILSLASRLPREIMHARQSIRITGLGIDMFDQYITAILRLYDLFKSYLPEGSIEPWMPSMEQNTFVLDIHNRYLTWKSNLVGKALEFDSTLDPTGIFTRRIPSDATYSEESQVLYFERDFNSQ